MQKKKLYCYRNKKTAAVRLNFFLSRVCALAIYWQLSKPKDFCGIVKIVCGKSASL